MIPIEQIRTELNDDDENETLVESSQHSRSDQAQSKYTDVDETAVKLNEDDDEQLSHDSSSAVATTNEAGKTVTE